MRPIVALLFLVPALAGCLSSGESAVESHASAAEAIGNPVELSHDHNDLTLHTAKHNVEFISWNPLGVELGENGFANFVLWSDDDEHLAFVAIDGDNDGGFVIADVGDPENVVVLGSYMAPGNSFQEVRVTPDGRFAVLNVQDLETNPQALPGHVAGTPGYCPACIHVVNIQDRSNPTLSSYTPVELLGTHNMEFMEQDGVLLLYYVGQPLSYSGAQSTPGNHVWIARLEDAGTSATLVPYSQFRHDNSGTEGRSFPHDVLVRQHPITGQIIAYVSHWDDGAITFDVTDPMSPQELGQADTYAPSDALAIHWFAPEPNARPDGRLIAWSAPEIGALESGTGVIRGYDVTDPAKPTQLGDWELPGEDMFIERGYIMSPHTVNVDSETLLAAVTHYHAGLWILDVSNPTNPRHVGLYTPHGSDGDPYTGPMWWKKPNFDPEGYGPNVYMARWDDRGDETILWATDRGTGLYALQYTGSIGTSNE